MKRDEVDFVARLRQFLPIRAMELVEEAGRPVDDARQENLYLVGGVVRDLFLERSCLDLDLVVEGDAVGLARRIAGDGENVVVHAGFGTAIIKGRGFNLDLASARCETYFRPGALPRIKISNMVDDLLRRDFSINAMAVRLSGERHGELVDPCGGKGDLADGLVRVLHDRSFVDDATRILRAVRYEQRFGFQLERGTDILLRRDIPYLDTISGDRLRHELERILREGRPERSLIRAEELGVLARLHPSLRADEWTAERFRRARQVYDEPPVPLYFALFCYRLKENELGQLLTRLNASRLLARTVRSTIALREHLESLKPSGLPASRINALLEINTTQAILANLIACDDLVVQDRMRLFLDKLKRVKPSLKGDDLLSLGVGPGPPVGQLLMRLRDAKLDGEVSTRAEEVEFVRRLLPK